jgi:hypothetical protein
VNDIATSASHRQRINAPCSVIQHIPRITPSQYDSAARGLGHFDPRKLRRSCATCASRDRYVNRKSKHRTVTGNCSHKRRLIMFTQSGNRRIDVLRADPHPPMVSLWDHRLEITGRATLGILSSADIAPSGIPCLLAVLCAVSSGNRDCENCGFKKGFLRHYCGGLAWTDAARVLDSSQCQCVEAKR